MLGGSHGVVVSIKFFHYFLFGGLGLKVNAKFIVGWEGKMVRPISWEL